MKTLLNGEPTRRAAIESDKQGRLLRRAARKAVSTPKTYAGKRTRVAKKANLAMTLKARDEARKPKAVAEAL